MLLFCPHFFIYSPFICLYTSTKFYSHLLQYSAHGSQVCPPCSIKPAVLYLGIRQLVLPSSRRLSLRLYCVPLRYLRLHCLHCVHLDRTAAGTSLTVLITLWTRRSCYIGSLHTYKPSTFASSVITFVSTYLQAPPLCSVPSHLLIFVLPRRLCYKVIPSNSKPSTQLESTAYRVSLLQSLFYSPYTFQRPSSVT